MSPFDSLYQSRLMTATDAVSTLRDGAAGALSMGASQPLGLMTALADRARRGAFTHLPLCYMHGSAAMAQALFHPELESITGR